MVGQLGSSMRSEHSSNPDAPVSGDVRRSGRWAPWVATGIIALIVIAAVVAYLRPDALTPRDKKRFPEPVSGTACLPLRRMEAALTKGKTDEFKAAVTEAEEKAITALDSSGISFGKPEKFALRLSGRGLNGLTIHQLRELRQKLNGVIASDCPSLPRREPV
jgi:hypothetical protein